MRLQSLSFILLLSTLILLSYSASPDLIVELFRHGARGPLNQTFDPEQKWGNDIGQLTPVGMRMHYLLGVALRDQYPEILTNYDPAKIYVRSTDLNRTIMSAYSHVYGIYKDLGPALGDKIVPEEAIPPYSSPIIQETVKKLDNSYALPTNLQVLPVHIASGTQDALLRPWDACPALSKWIRLDGTDLESKEVFEQDMSEIVKFLKEKGLKIEKMIDLYYAGDNGIANKAQGVPLPGHTDPNSQQYKDLKFAFEWFTLKLFAGDYRQKALYALNLLNSIQDSMKAVLNGTSSLNFISLSAHDTTLLTVLSAFDIVTMECLLDNYKSEKEGKGKVHPDCEYPQYASTLIFEFYKAPEPYVALKYNGNDLAFCDVKGEKCTLPKFGNYVKKVTNSYTMDDFNRLCGIYVDSKGSHSGWLILLAIISAGLSAALYFTCMDLRKKTKELETQPGQSGDYYSTP